MTKYRTAGSSDSCLAAADAVSTPLLASAADAEPFAWPFAVPEAPLLAADSRLSSSLMLCCGGASAAAPLFGWSRPLPYVSCGGKALADL